MSETKKRFKIVISVNGTLLTFSACVLLPEEDNTFLRFSDRSGTILRYNKNSVISMEELK